MYSMHTQHRVLDTRFACTSTLAKKVKQANGQVYICSRSLPIPPPPHNTSHRIKSSHALTAHSPVSSKVRSVPFRTVLLVGFSIYLDIELAERCTLGS